jgi:Tol biopolymer transport system component
LSGDGRYLAFASTAPLTVAAARIQAKSTSGRRRPLSLVYLRDVQKSLTRLASVGMGGKPADNDSWAPALSADGCALAFVSNATNLVKGDRNRSSDIFLLNLVNGDGRGEGSVELISRNVKVESGNGGSRRPALSMDGQFVVFQSEASDLVRPGADINLLPDVFLFDRRVGQATHLSADPASEWMEASGSPAIDGSGRIVAFSSRHPINAADTRNDFDLFVLDLTRH